MSSPWTSPDPTQYDLGHADAVPPQNGQAAQAPQPVYPGPSGQPAFAPPGAGPAGVAAPQPAYAAPDTPGNSAPTASGYSQASTWSWAPKPGIIPLRPLTLTDLFSGSFSALRKNPSVLFGFTIIVMTVVALLSLAGTMLPLFSFTSLMGDLDPQASSKALLDSAYMSVVSTIVGYIALLAGSFLAGTVLDGVLSVAVSQLVIGKKITFKQSWALVKPRLWSMLGASFLSMLAVGSPLLVLVILFFMSLYSWPGSDAFFSLFGLLLALALPVVLVSYVISIRFLYAPICAVLEEKGPIEAVKRSWALTSGSFWVTLGRVILINVVVDDHPVRSDLGSPDARLLTRGPHPGGVPDPHVRGREDPQGEFRAPPRPRKPGLGGVGCVRVRSSPDARRGRGSVVAERRTRALRLQHRFERF